MAWQNPKTDWKAGDVPTASDFNSIEGNIAELRNASGITIRDVGGRISAIYVEGALQELYSQCL